MLIARRLSAITSISSASPSTLPAGPRGGDGERPRRPGRRVAACGLGLGRRVRRDRQDQGARRPGAAAPARRHPAGPDPRAHLHPGGGGRDGQPDIRGARDVVDDARRRARKHACRVARGTARRRYCRPGARPFSPGARCAGRDEDPDHPRLLPVRARPLSARSAHQSAFQRDGRAHRGGDPAPRPRRRNRRGGARSRLPRSPGRSSPSPRGAGRACSTA